MGKCMGQIELKIIQISDTHVFADQSQSLLGVPTQQSFEAVLKHIREANHSIDFIIHSGDISQDYSEVSYMRVADMLSTFNVPVYCVPGNHDDSNKMAKVYPREKMSTDKQILSKHWQLILLDSHQNGMVKGYLDQSQLTYLEHCLQQYPQHHAIIIFHHHPLPVGSEWLDNLWLTNAPDFWQLISRYPQVNTVLFGHVHQQFEQSHQGIACYSTPSTCIQFKRKQDHFGLENLNQGYRWIHLFDDGHLETAVVRLPHYIGEFDDKAKGY
jgi:Icc protein